MYDVLHDSGGGAYHRGRGRSYRGLDDGSVGVGGNITGNGRKPGYTVIAPAMSVDKDASRAAP